MTSRAGLLAALLCLPALAAEPVVTEPTKTGPPKAERPPGAVLDEINGTVKAVDRRAQSVTIETAGGPIDVRLDRNTLVYQPGGATTVTSIADGATVRCGVDSARRAFWIQLRPAGQAPAAAATPLSAPTPAAPPETKP